MPSKQYWKKRMESVANVQNKKCDKYIASLEKEYLAALKSIKNDLLHFYIKYANAESVDLSTAKRMLTNAEKEIWEVSLQEYKKMALDGGFKDELDSMYAKSRISRLKALELQIQIELEKLYKGIQNGTEILLKDTYLDTYYRTIYEIEKGIGATTNFAIYNQDAVNKIISKPWKFGHFSSTIWKNKQLLLDELQTTLTQSFIRGDTMDKVIDAFEKKMNTGKTRAARVIQTEHAYIAGEATAKSYQETGVEKYEYLATLDLHTSQICRDMDGKVFKISEKIVWLNYPPLHCNCRSTTVPHFDNLDTWLEQRAARNLQTNKTRNVWGDTTYHEWYELNVRGRGEIELSERKLKNIYSDKKQYEEYKQVLGKEAPKTFDEFQNIKYNSSDEWDKLKVFINSKNSGRISKDATLKQWKNIEREVHEKIVGKTTPNGIKIQQVSYHIVERFIGDGEKRKGVLVEDVRNALFKPLEIRSEKVDSLGRKSQKFIGEEATVSINPDTGNMIQTNPTSSKVAEKFKRRIEDDTSKQGST